MTDERTTPVPSGTPDSGDRLEHLIDRALRDLPLRQAPHTLEARVLASIERRSALPWWKNSFLNWPLPARLAFLLASCGVVKLALEAVVWLFADLHSAAVSGRLAGPADSLRAASRALSIAASLGESIVHAIPSHWLYAAIAVCAALYGALFALGATAYHTLYLRK